MKIDCAEKPAFCEVEGAMVEEVDSLSLPESPSSESPSSCSPSSGVLRVDSEEGSGWGASAVEIEVEVEVEGDDSEGSVVNLVSPSWACWTTCPKSFLAL